MTLPDAPTHTDNGNPPMSSRERALAALRAEHAQIGQDREPLVLEVPGLEHMAVRYKWYPLSADEKAAQRILKLKDFTAKNVESAIATVLNACDELLLMDPDDPRADKDGWAPLTQPAEPPIKFDRTLCDVMEWPHPELMGARQIVRTLFGGEHGERALLRHAIEVTEWLEGESVSADEEFAKN